MEEKGLRQPMLFVVEKDPAEREDLRRTLGDAGMTVLALESLEGAASLLESGAVCDLLLVSGDCMEDGEERLDRILGLAGPSLKVILYGGDPESKAALYCLNRGACDFLDKPFDRDMLMRAVEEALGGEYHVEDDAEGIVAERPVRGWIELTASSRLEQLRRLERFSELLFNSHFPKKVREDLQLAVEEVGRNAVEWGNRFDPDKRVHVSYCLFDDRIVIKVEDEGEGFAPQAVPDPTADPAKSMEDRMKAGKRPGGYGVYLIQKLVDQVVYSEKGNTVLMIKYLPTGDPAAAENATEA